MHKLIKTWTLLWIFFPTSPEEVMEVWWEGGRDGWTFAACDTQQHFNVVMQISVWDFVGKEFKEDHAVRKKVTFLVDPSNTRPHYLWRHPAICSSLLSS